KQPAFEVQAPSGKQLQGASGKQAASNVQGPRRKRLAFDVQGLRRKMHISQREFAGMFGFPVATLRHWERGNRQPVGAALVLLHVVNENPLVVRRAVQKARAHDAGCLAPFEAPLSYRSPPGFGARPPPIKPRGQRRKPTDWV
ncbi:MAG: hypothetical protein ABIQ72_05405, partial [Usitatibacter sp.]